MTQFSFSEERCKRCNKSVSEVFYEIEDTSTHHRIKFCIKCGNEFKEWLNNGVVNNKQQK